MEYKEIMSAIFADFGTEFLVNEITEAKSLLKDYIPFHFVTSETETEQVIEIALAIAESVEWRKKEFSE